MENQSNLSPSPRIEINRKSIGSLCSDRIDNTDIRSELTKQNGIIIGEAWLRGERKADMRTNETSNFLRV